MSSSVSSSFFSLRTSRLTRVRLVISSLVQRCLSSPTPSSLSECSDYLFVLLRDSDIEFRSLSLLSLTLLLNDLLPGYKLHDKASQEQNGQISASVKANWKFEGSLLALFKRFSDWLMKELTLRLSHFSPSFSCFPPYDSALFRSLSALITRAENSVSAPDIYLSLLRFSVSLVHCSYSLVRSQVFSSLLLVYKLDQSFTLSARLVELNSTILKAKFKAGRGAIRSESLELLNSAPIKGEILHANFSSERQKFGKKKNKKKEHKENQKELEKDFSEGNAEFSLATRQENQRKMLLKVLEINFLALKRRFHSSLLIRPVLRCLTRLAELINIELVLDLLEELKNALPTSISLSLEDRLSILECAFSILQKHLQVIEIDEIVFYRHFCHLLMHLPVQLHSRPISSSLPSLLHRCFSLLFFQRSRSIPLIRAETFFKLTVQSIVHCSSNSNLRLTLSQIVQQFLVSFPLLRPLVDSPEEEPPALTASLINSEDGLPDCDQMQFPSKTLWELPLLLASYNQEVTQFTHFIAQEKFSNVESNRKVSGDLSHPSNELLTSFSAAQSLASHQRNSKKRKR
jgi:hypothetical protein